MSKLTEGQLYDLYDGSLEHKLVDKLDKDLFDIRKMLPEQAVEELTDDNINEKSELIASLLVKADGGDLGLRKELIQIGLRDRYLGLRNTLVTMGNDPKNAVQEKIKRLLALAPRNLMLLVLNTQVEDEEERKYKLGLYATELQANMYRATEDKINVEVLHFVKNVLEEYDSSLTVYLETFKEAIEKLNLLGEYVYEERYYNPENFKRVLMEDITSDIKWTYMSDFPINEFMESGSKEHHPLYSAYLDLIKPIKETKALSRIWEGQDVEDLLLLVPDQVGLFDKDKYIFENNILVMFRDGLTAVQSNGEYEHIASSKVKKADYEDLKEALEVE